MNLYKVTATFNGKTTEIQVRTSSRRAAITRASLHLIPLDNKRDKAGKEIRYDLDGPSQVRSLRDAVQGCGDQAD